MMQKIIDTMTDVLGALTFILLIVVVVFEIVWGIKLLIGVE